MYISVVLVTHFIINPECLREPTIFISHSFLYLVLLMFFFLLHASATEDHALDLNGINTLLANGVSRFFMNVFRLSGDEDLS